jgi:ketosteroid isomerase-like protein
MTLDQPTTAAATVTDALGVRLAEAIATKDTDALTALLAPDLDFRAVTPRKFWEATTPDEVLAVLFDNWFKESDRIDGLVRVAEGDDVEDTHQVGYRFAITNPDGAHTVEQQAYYRTDGGRISYLRVMCSGYRPAG